MSTSFSKYFFNNLKSYVPFGKAQLIYYLKHEILSSCKSVLDLGCGSDSPISSFSHNIAYSVGVDLFDESIASSRKAKIHNGYIKMNILDIEDTFKAKSFDCVLAMDLIEHFNKDDGYKLIRSMEKIGKNKIIIFTPNGFVPQEEYCNNIYQEHLSGWIPQEMQDLGFRTLGFLGWKALRGDLANIKYKPKLIWSVFSLLTQPYTKSHPEYAYGLLCIKDL